MNSLLNTIKSTQSQYKKVFVVLKPGFLHLSKIILDIFKKSGWIVDQTVIKQLQLSEAKSLYISHKKEDFYDDLCKYMASGPSRAFIFKKPGKYTANTFSAVASIKDKIRNKYGESDMKNVLHSSDSKEAMNHESSIYFYRPINESVFDAFDDEGNVTTDSSELIKQEITDWINKNYMCQGYFEFDKKQSHDGKYIVNCDEVYVFNKHITSLTNDYFVWGKIGRDFICENCRNLKTLEGAPEKVGTRFSCDWCTSLKSLEGAPEKVGKFFTCRHCKSLKTLEGAPKEVKNYFSCSGCDGLTSLKGAPEKVNDFCCIGCFSLKSLKYLPKLITGTLDCSGNKQFGEEDIPSTSKILGRIIY